MAIMIPDVPVEIPIGSREDEMFNALAKLSDDFYVFHSFVLVTSVEGALYESETDFVIFNPTKGIICLEAKAGCVSCVNGEWFYQSGKKMSRGGPYRQADLNKWKLEKYFEKNNMLDLWEKCKVLHAVWFPGINKSQLNTIHFTSDGDRAITLTEEALTNTETEIERLFSLQLPIRNEMRITAAEP